jgi:hypothetical protein
VEHRFHVVKSLFKRREVCCRGLVKNGAQLFTLVQPGESGAGYPPVATPAEVCPLNGDKAAWPPAKTAPPKEPAG